MYLKFNPRKELRRLARGGQPDISLQPLAIAVLGRWDEAEKRAAKVPTRAKNRCGLFICGGRRPEPGK
jgi:hypothetical protein